MKRLISLSIGLSLLASPLSSAESTTFECGEWDDVSSTYMDVMVEVCELEIMGGNTTSYFGNDIGINRAEAATVGNRLYFGSDDYNDLDESSSVYLSDLQLRFSDVPPNEWWNEWILKAMYYSVDSGIMSGDANAGTFRPTDSVTTAEFLKILYESAKGGDLLDEDHVWNLSYSGATWYSSIVPAYSDMGLLENYDVYDTKFIEFRVHYDMDDDSKYHNIRLDLDEEITRRDVGFLIYEMMHRDIMETPFNYALGENS